MDKPSKTVVERLADANEIIRQKNARLVVLERDLRRRSAENLSNEIIRKEIYGLSEVSPSPAKWAKTIAHAKSTTGIPLIFLSDWHWGETVFKDQTGGANAFNRQIAKQRVRVLHDTVNDLCFNHMTNPHYPGAVIAIGGDMITGAIHDELRETNDGPVQLSVLEVEEQLIGLIDSWATKFCGPLPKWKAGDPTILVPCVPGNHGRDTFKPRMKNRMFQSYEWNIYMHIERHFQSDPRVHVHVPNEVDAHFTIFGHRFMMTHGDALGVKGGDGIIGAIGPIARGAMKVGRSEAQIGRDYDTLIIGHYHTYIPRGDAVPVLANGCLIGYNEYARLGLRVPFSRPTQALAFIHPKHGFTAQWPMYLDGKRQAAATAEPWTVWGGK